MFPYGGNDKGAEREPGPLIGSCRIAQRNYGHEFLVEAGGNSDDAFQLTIYKIG